LITPVKLMPVIKLAWVSMIKTPIFLKYEDQLMSCLMLLPVVLLVFGLAGSLVVLWKKKYGNRG
ncbi:hypothetical protein ACUOA8_06470, partial [Escherichia sp. SS-MK2]